jgi:DNA-binding transcriptional LysR family regulator
LNEGNQFDIFWGVGERLDCELQIGRRIRLRDLHIFLTVTQRGSMAAAAAQLGVSQPAVSGVIADLERTLGVQLFERSTRGVTPTMYAREMMDRSVAAFDELKQGIRTLENLADPEAGEMWIGCVESISVLTLPPILQEFMRRYPRVVVHVLRLSPPMLEFRDLFERNLDLVLARRPTKPMKNGDELSCEPLFDDQLAVVAGARSRWTRRKKLDLADLVDEPWVLTRPDCWAHTAITEAFLNRGLKVPHVRCMTQSMPLRASLAASGPYITVFANSRSSLGPYRHLVKRLPIDLPECICPLAIITLRDRLLNPVAQRFIEYLRTYAASHSEFSSGRSKDPTLSA